MASIEKKRIGDLLNDDKKKYFIPSYQRGYKWTEREVTDLLEDITKYEKNEKSLYLLQPIVVKENKNKEKDYDYELIDGQQRLTTIYIILCYLLNKFDKEDIKSLYKIKYSIASLYSIEYETREKSESYLKCFQKYDNIENQNEINKYKNDNSDYFYMNNTYQTVRKFFEKGVGVDNEKEFLNKLFLFLEKLTDYTQVIWYVSNGQDNSLPEDEGEKSTDVFKRLNIGKIPLENSELLKARFLSSANFKKGNTALKQASIAIEWDNIEYTLQNEQFWYFIYGEEYTSANRINYIFDLIRILDRRNVKELYEKSKRFDKDKDFYKFIGNDEKRTFRYIDFYITEIEEKENENNNIRETIIDELWIDVKKIFRIFTEWYNDIKLYHYVGFLINCRRSKDVKPKHRMISILSKWYELSGNDDEINTNNNGKLKVDFVNYLKKQITAQIKEDLDYKSKEFSYEDFENLIETMEFYDSREEVSKEEGEKLLDKKNTYNLLLLHNLQTIVNQHENYEKYEDKFTGGFFTKFPFNLFKNDNWEIEHINPAVPKKIDQIKDCKDYLMGASDASYLYVNNEELKKDVNNALGICYKYKTKEPSKQDKQYKVDLNYCINVINKISKENEKLNGGDSKINYIQNYVLLDKSTNSGYGNAFFSGKRLYILGKDQGQRKKLDIVQKKIDNTDTTNDSIYEYEVKASDDEDKKGTKPFISFVLPCTKNVFLKYYTGKPSDLLKWDLSDAEAYLDNIKDVLKHVLVEDSNEGEMNNE